MKAHKWLRLIACIINFLWANSMIITEISAQKRKGRYNLFVDGEFYSGLDAEHIIKNGLKVGLEISKEKLEQIVSESEIRSAFDKLVKMISNHMHTKFEIKQKLINLGYSDSAVLGAINKAEEYGYVDDDLYAKMFIDSKSNKSKLEIKLLLSKKGIKKEIVSDKTEMITDDIEEQKALNLAEKYMKNKVVDQKSMSGLYGYLARKGFMFDAINHVLKKYKFEEIQE